MGAWLYILHCADGSYYTGTTRADLEQRVAEHEAGHFGGFTATRRPVTLVFSEYFEAVTDAIAAERRIKGWSRAKKEALMAGDFQRLADLAKRRQPGPPMVRDASLRDAPHHEAEKRRTHAAQTHSSRRNPA
jgi:putative endonuclease